MVTATANGHVSMTGVGYLQALQLAKAHDQSIVGIEFLVDRRTRQPYLFTFARNSIKLWLWIPSRAVVGNSELVEIKTISSWLCGMQSYDMKMFGSGRNRSVVITVVGVDSTLHWISFRFPPREGEEPETTQFNRGLMETWNGTLTSTGEGVVAASFSGSLQLLGRGGDPILSAPFERVKQLSTLIHGENLLVAGSTQGLISVIDPHTLAVRFAVEGHMMRIRCLVLTQHDTQLLSASDDKTVRLYTLSESKGAFIRSFCGHTGAVMSLRVDDSSAGERFASASVDGRLILWNMQSGEKLHVFENAEADAVGLMEAAFMTFMTKRIEPVRLFQLHCVTFSPDGCYLATGSDRASIAIFKIPQSENFVNEERWSDLGEVDNDDDDGAEENVIEEEHEQPQNNTEEVVEPDDGDFENPLMDEEEEDNVEEEWQVADPNLNSPSGTEGFNEAGNPEHQLYEAENVDYGTEPLTTDNANERREGSADEDESERIAQEAQLDID